MKKVCILLVAILAVSSPLLAQHGGRGGHEQMNPQERSQRMTERMAKEYALTDQQKSELLALNLAWAEKMEANRGDRKPEMRPDQKEPKRDKKKMKQGKKGKDCQADNNCCPRKEKQKNKQVSQRGSEEREKRGEAMRASRDEYNAQVKKIMTQEQYEAYTAKQLQRRG